jgi:hypothetical protein
MTHLKKTLALAVMAVLAASPAFAQDKSAEDMAKAATEKWKSILNLSDEQAAKFQNVSLDTQKKLAEAKTAAGGDKAKFTESAKSIWQDHDAQLERILTPEQMKTYREKSAELKKAREKAKESGQ